MVLETNITESFVIRPMSPKHQKCKHSIVSEDMIFGKMQMDVESPKCQNINALKNAKEATTPSQKHHRRMQTIH